MPVFKLEGEYVQPKVEFTVYVEAKDEAEARKLFDQLGDWRSNLDGALHDEIYDAMEQHWRGWESTAWNFVKPGDDVPEDARVVKLAEGWDG